MLTLYKDLRILYSHEKRKLSNGQLWKIWKETAFIELCSFFIDILAFEQGKLCPGVGIFVSFFRPGGRSFALKSCQGGGDFDGKISGPRGMVTGQIDTCINGQLIQIVLLYFLYIILVLCPSHTCLLQCRPDIA